jgi:hypothetical protein
MAAPASWDRPRRTDANVMGIFQTHLVGFEPTLLLAIVPVRVPAAGNRSVTDIRNLAEPSRARSKFTDARKRD